MRELINIATYPTPHNNGNGGGRGVTYVTYNGSSGINNSSANSGRMNFNSVNGGEGQFTYILAQDGTIIKIEGDELNYNFGFIGELESNKITTGQLKADDADILKAYIGTLDSKKITTEYLTVTKQAHFFELIIDKVRAVGGQIILTPAQCLADVVIPRDANLDPVNLYKEDGELVNNIADLLRQVKYFDVYFKSKNSEDIEVANEWFADSTTHSHDQAFCQSFNIEAGTHQNVSNKYYWRQVYDLLPDKMVNLTTSQIANIGNSLTATNNIHVSLLPTTIGGSPNGMAWQAEAQSLQKIPATVQWTDISGTNNAINGLMKTDSTVLGIQITPTGSNSYYMTDKLQFQMYYTDADGANFGAPEGMKVGVYYTDGTSEYFTNFTYDASNTTTLNLHPDNSIESIIVVCTEPVQWTKCHGIRLSNDTNDSNSMDPETLQAIVRGDSVAQASIPEPGDSIVQLGYQPSGPDDPNAELAGYSRQSAIIISAYHSPDTDLTAPSYAQYMGINDYDLKSHRGSYIDGNGAQFLGDITLAKYRQNGENVTLMSKFELTEQGIQTWVGEQDYANKTYVGSQISQTADNITTWVGQQDYANKTYVGSQISQSADNITTWVGQQDYANKTYVGSQITQSESSIQTWVGQQDYANKTYVGSQISQSADNITTWVGQQDYADKTYVGSQISQSATSISATVTENIKGELLETGIDIANRTITLKADKTILENVTSSSATWLKGNVNGQTKWDLAINEYSPIMRFGNTSSLTSTTYLKSDSLHINTDGYNTNFATLQVVSNEPALFLTQGSNSIEMKANNQPYLKISRGTNNIKLYINSSGDICLEGTFLHNGDTSSRKVLVLDGGGFLKLQ